MANCIAYLNGKYLSESEISISPMDRGFLYGDGVFETVRTVNGRVISFHDHAFRLIDACERVRIPLTVTPTDLREIIAQLLRRNDWTDATIRITVSRGVSNQLGYGYSKNQKPTVLGVVRPAKPIPEALYEKGVAAEFMVAPFARASAPGIKSLSALHHVLAKQSALDHDCYEAILTDAFDTVYEGTSSNIFMIRDNKLLTPPAASGVLPGITRSRILKLCPLLQIPVTEVFFTKSDLLLADEVFLTNTNVEILPVTKIGGKVIGGGAIGNTTRRIREAFRQTLIEILE